MMFAVDSAGVPSTREDAAHQHRLDAEHGGRLHADDRRQRWRRRSACVPGGRDARRRARPLRRQLRESSRPAVRQGRSIRRVGSAIRSRRLVTGTTATGTLFDKVCPRDSAVSGFRGVSSQYVNQIEFQCRALTPSGGLTGTGTYLGQQSAAPAAPCRACRPAAPSNPGYALYGRSGGWVDSFGMLCRTGVDHADQHERNAGESCNPGVQTWRRGCARQLANHGDR